MYYVKKEDVKCLKYPYLSFLLYISSSLFFQFLFFSPYFLLPSLFPLLPLSDLFLQQYYEDSVLFLS
jgi:hypothetical protein